MNKKELKGLIKEMVRQSLMELFAEMHLENIVESVVQKQKPSSYVANRLTEQQQEEEVIERPRQQRQVQKPRAIMKEDVIRNLGVTDDQWKSIYADIDPSSLPPAIDSAPTMENRELVSESTLEQMGLMRDYSEFLK